MSVICVEGVPAKWSLLAVVKALSKVIDGQFKALNFGPHGRFQEFKECYLRLDKSLNAQSVIEAIGQRTYPKGAQLQAHIPKKVPQLQLRVGKSKKALQRKMKKDPVYTPTQILKLTHIEIMTELQSKYTGLFNLSRNIGHRLCEDLAKTIFDRLQTLMEHGDESLDCFKLSQAYRRAHPHFADFQLVLRSLQRLQDALGAPRQHLQEAELCAPPRVDHSITYEELQPACQKYSDKITHTLKEYVSELDTDITGDESEEGKARKKVRQVLKNMSPFMSYIIGQVMKSHFLSEVPQSYRMRIYGEPFLPGKAHMAALVDKHRSRERPRVARSRRMYNLLLFHTHAATYPRLMQLDGSSVGGAKLIIRPSDMPIYKVNTWTFKKWFEAAGVECEEMEENSEAEDLEEEAEE